MKEKNKWIRITYILGVTIFIIGTIDPLEGSVLILAGSLLLTFSAYFSGDKHFKLFLTLFLLMIIGVFFLFYLSSLGGFGDQYLSWWWATLVLPYPISWISTVALLIYRARKNQVTS
jgi:hypothetical protein